MAASSPADLVQAIAEAISSGDLQGILGLYEAEATFVPPGAPASDAVRGKEAAGRVFSQFLQMDPKLSVDVKKVIESSGIALTIGDWNLTGTGPDGEVNLSGTFADVMRRQADGTWLYVIDNPDGVA